MDNGRSDGRSCRVHGVVHRPADKDVRPGHSGLLSFIYRLCAVVMGFMALLFFGSWAEGLQPAGQAWFIVLLCSGVAFLMLRGAGDV